MITVCVATYNGASYVRLQLESILSQLPQNAEVVIADDGSTDGTLEVIASLQDARIRLLPASSHLGPTYNFERALQEAKGDVIFLADQDDIWMSGKVQSMLDALGGDVSTAPAGMAILAVHDASFMDGEGRPLTVSTSGGSVSRMWEDRPYKSGLFRNWLKNTYTGCCMAFRREMLEKALPFPKNLPMHDQWLGLMAERHFKVAAIQKPLIQYRIHEKNATQLVGGKSRGFVQRLKWRLDLLRSLLH